VYISSFMKIDKLCYSRTISCEEIVWYI